MASFKCAKCGGIITANVRQAEDIGTCPHCGQKYRLPRKPAQASSPAPAKAAEPASSKHSRPGHRDLDEEESGPYGVSSQPVPTRRVADLYPSSKEDAEDEAESAAPVRVKRKKRHEEPVRGSKSDLIGFLVLVGIAILTIAAAAVVLIVNN